MQDAAVIGVLLDFAGNAVHGRDGLGGIGAGGGLGRKHHRVGAFEHGGGDIGHLGAGRNRRSGHAFEHLRRHDNGFAAISCRAQKLLLDARDLLQRKFDAEVAARHHNAVGNVEDVVHRGNRGAPFDLRHQPSAI